jgi:hypothetical protein
MGKILPFQNVIEIKDQLSLKVLLTNWWGPGSEVGSFRNTKKKGSE